MIRPSSFGFIICLGLVSGLWAAPARAGNVQTLSGTCGKAAPAVGANSLYVDSNGGLCGGAAAVTVTGRGGTITTGGTDQVLAAANAARHVLWVQNPCTIATQGIAATEDLFLNIGAAAGTTGSANLVELQPCQSFILLANGQLTDTEAVHVIAATTGHVFYAKEW